MTPDRQGGPAPVAAARREFAVCLLLFVVPYGIAVVVQDVAVPALRDGRSWPVALGALGIVATIAILALRRRGRPQPFSTDRDRTIDALGAEPIEPAGVAAVSDEQLPELARRLATLVRWVRQDVANVALPCVVNGHLADLAAQAERMQTAVGRLADRRAPGPQRRPTRSAPRARARQGARAHGFGGSTTSENQ
jgi:hypothetical protein